MTPSGGKKGGGKKDSLPHGEMTPRTVRMKMTNEFLARMYLPEHNRKFQVEPASPTDTHQVVPKGLNEILSWEAEGVVQRDWTVACEGQWYEWDNLREALSLAGKRGVRAPAAGWNRATGMRRGETAKASLRPDGLSARTSNRGPPKYPGRPPNLRRIIRGGCSGLGEPGCRPQPALAPRAVAAHSWPAKAI